MRFPVPLYPLISADVLVESFEEGDHITSYIESINNPYNHRWGHVWSRAVERAEDHSHKSVPARSILPLPNPALARIHTHTPSHITLTCIHTLTHSHSISLAHTLLRLSELGSGTMLQMMLVDNLIHSDLHPGNILVRLNAPTGLLGLLYRGLEKVKAHTQVREREPVGRERRERGRGIV